jgi:hypothetical protein
MRTAAILLLTAASVSLFPARAPRPESAAAAPKVYPYRWVYMRNGLASEEDVKRFAGIAETAARHGLNGILLHGALDSMDRQPPEYFGRLKRAKAIAGQLQLEIIPSGFGAGYGGSILGADKNLAAGLPVRGALFVAGAKEALFSPGRPPALANGGFEPSPGGVLEGFSGQAPGERTFVDTSVFREGKASLRFENVPREQDVQLQQAIRVEPYRCYRFKVWVKTAGVSPSAPLFIRAMSSDGRRDMARFEPALPPSSDWTQYAGAFNSWFSNRMTIQVGVSGGAQGRIWIDGLEIEEVGLVNVLRRPGTPVRVRDENTGQPREEGLDYAPIADPRLDFRWDHEGPPIKLLPGGRIRPGDRLRVDYFHGTTIYRDQIVLCLSEPKVMEIWARQIPLIEKHLAPKKYLLNTNEVRIGGHCEACQRRRTGMAQMVGEHVAGLHRMIRAANPKAEILVWSDMFDPHHNARNHYYMVDGDFTGSWEHIPKDLIIACWYHRRRNLSLGHFSRLGFRTLAGAYYDADDLQNPKDWLESLDRTPGAIGIMYTTWENKYKLLAGFGELVSKR